MLAVAHPGPPSKSGKFHAKLGDYHVKHPGVCNTINYWKLLARPQKNKALMGSCGRATEEGSPPPSTQLVATVPPKKPSRKWTDELICIFVLVLAFAAALIPATDIHSLLLLFGTGAQLRFECAPLSVVI